MNDALVEQAFAQMGARAQVIRVPRATTSSPIRVNVLRDAGGEYFELTRLWDVELSAPEVVLSDRHLLLAADRPNQPNPSSRFLCGFDERSWFVAAVPESAGARTVQEAKDALKPEEVWASMREYDVPMDQRDLRCTAGFVRQGEWFFLPRPILEVDAADILRDEPIQRGGGAPHWCEYVYRTGGEDAWVSAGYPNGLTQDEYASLDERDRRRWFWRVARRNAEVYAGGRVRHRDHATIVLPHWYRVVMNTETRAAAMEQVEFLD